jgi:hypothetical protein
MELIPFRRAVASLIFAANGLLWLVNALLGPSEMWAVTAAMTAVYAIAYFAVSADFFWGRWFGMGLCYFGSLYLLALLQNPEYSAFLGVLGGSHVLALLCLYGSSMASRYEGSPEWRLTFNIDEDTARRLGRSVQSAATTLPILILQLLGPRPESSLLVLTVFGLAIAGLYGLLHLRTWSLLALGGAGVGLLSTLLLPAERLGAPFTGLMPSGLSTEMLLLGSAGLILPLLLWARPFRRSLRA